MSPAVQNDPRDVFLRVESTRRELPAQLANEHSLIVGVRCRQQLRPVQRALLERRMPGRVQSDVERQHVRLVGIDRRVVFADGHLSANVRDEPEPIVVEPPRGCDAESVHEPPVRQRDVDDERRCVLERCRTRRGCRPADRRSRACSPSRRVAIATRRARTLIQASALGVDDANAVGARPAIRHARRESPSRRRARASAIRGDRAPAQFTVPFSTPSNDASPAIASGSASSRDDGRR